METRTESLIMGAGFIIEHVPLAAQIQTQMGVAAVTNPSMRWDGILILGA